MAKSLRSKWKRKMRAIKREKMDVKVLARMNKMLLDSVAEQKLDAEEEKLKQQKALMKSSAAAEMVEAPPAELPASVSPADAPEVPMDTESDSDSDAESVDDTETVIIENGRKRKFRKPSTKTMRNEKNQFPVWMSTKKIKYHKRLAKKSAKRNTKEAKKMKQWKRACAL